MTLNCQGLGDSEKRRDVLNYIKNKKCIYCIKDTHFTNELEPYIQTQWGYTCLFSSCTSNSRGVSILLNNIFKHDIHRVKKDISWNYIIIDITIEGERITIANIYGPNRDEPIFFLNILDYIEDFGNELIHTLWGF